MATTARPMVLGGAVRSLRLAELKDDDFTQKAPAIAAECGIRETPKSMSDLAKRYADLLGGSQARIDASLLTGASSILPVDRGFWQSLKKYSPAFVNV